MPEIKDLQLAPVSEFLDKGEMRQLTGRAQVNKQQEWLQSQGVAHRRDGARLIVSRHHVRAWLEGKEARPKREPNWAALNAPSVWPREINEREKAQRSTEARRAVLWAYYAELINKIDNSKLACPEFHRITTEGRASRHFAKCDACLAIRAHYFPKP